MCLQNNDSFTLEDMIARLIEFLDEKCEEQSLKDSWTLEEEKLEFITRKAEEITNRLEKKLDNDVSKKKLLKLEVSHDYYYLFIHRSDTEPVGSCEWYLL